MIYGIEKLEYYNMICFLSLLIVFPATKRLAQIEKNCNFIGTKIPQMLFKNSHSD